MSLMHDRAPLAMLLDIEGTTTPISFVYDVLFPYAASALEDHLRQSWGQDAWRQDLDLLIAQASQDPSLPPLGPAPTLEHVLANLRWQMDHDIKSTGLKSIQGKIWERGYAQGQIQGALFEDVAPMMRAWRAQGRAIFIYSSGSVHAQQLLFGHSQAGDLRPMIDGYFDTTTGPKKSSDSYTAIAQRIGQDPAQVLFATDNLDEALAARAAGMRVALMRRPGNPEVPTHDVPEAIDFTSL